MIKQEIYGTLQRPPNFAILKSPRLRDQIGEAHHIMWSNWVRPILDDIDRGIVYQLGIQQLTDMEIPYKLVKPSEWTRLREWLANAPRPKWDELPAQKQQVCLIWADSILKYLQDVTNDEILLGAQHIHHTSLNMVDRLTTGLNPELLLRWRVLAITPYCELTQDMKDKDIDESRSLLKAIGR